MEDHAYSELISQHHKMLRELLAANVHGTVSQQQYGQVREKGYISRTMGVMAGGDFIDKIVDLAVVKNQDLQTVAAKVRWGLQQVRKKWHHWQTDPGSARIKLLRFCGQCDSLYF